MRHEWIRSRVYPTIIMLCRYHRGPVPRWAPSRDPEQLPANMVLVPNTHLVRSAPADTLVLFLDPTGSFTRVDLYPPATAVWHLLDGQRTVADVVADSPMDEEDTLLLLAELRNCWAVRPQDN